MAKWEYVKIDAEDYLQPDNLMEVEEVLNKYGNEGWELVSVGETDDFYIGWMIFKRQRYDDTAAPYDR